MFSQDVCNDSLICSFVVESAETVEKGKVCIVLPLKKWFDSFLQEVNLL